jgi:hypothetical protein
MTTQPSPFDQARDELFQHIMRCGVIGSEEEHMKEWFDETMTYLAERYHELNKKEVADLRTLGERFAAPTKKVETAQNPGSATENGTVDAGELDAVSAA